MMRRLLLAIFVIGITTSIWAEPISREQALRQAQRFILQKGKSTVLNQAETSMSKARARGKQIPDYYYVFNVGQNEGFVIVSGDDRAETVLGYSDKGYFDIDKIPSNMAAWLKGYEAQIRALRENHVSVSKKNVAQVSYPTVEPIVKVHWDQNSPYNKYCRLDLPKHHINAPTGCVATAMAQAMSVYRYPSATTAEIPYYEVDFGPSGIASYDPIPADTPIDWNNMDVLNYNGSEDDTKIKAIANFMSYCGRSVQMIYNGGGSEAPVSDVAYALKTYFGYGKQTAYKKREWSSNKDWNQMIYHEVASGRPVIYGGQTAEDGGEGHAFIIDGYDGGTDAFHINWGWGQLTVSPDGYYKLSALDPPIEGTGGSSEAYSFSQEAVIGIAKEDGTFSEDVKLTTEYIELDDQSEFTRREGSQFYITFKAKFVSRLANYYDISYNYAIYKDGIFMEYLNPNAPLNTFTFTNSTYFPHDGVIRMYLPYYDGATSYNAFRTPGTYKIVPVSREVSAKEWLENDGSDRYYLTAVCTDTKLTIYVGDPNAKDGDANGDGDVNAADVVFVIEAMGKDYDTNKAADVNGDGVINVADVVYIINRIL